MLVFYYFCFLSFLLYQMTQAKTGAPLFGTLQGMRGLGQELRFF